MICPTVTNLVLYILVITLASPLQSTLASWSNVGGGGGEIGGVDAEGRGQMGGTEVDHKDMLDKIFGALDVLEYSTSRLGTFGVCVQ